jgi:hypothetical protein
MRVASIAGGRRSEMKGGKGKWREVERNEGRK